MESLEVEVAVLHLPSGRRGVAHYLAVADDFGRMQVVLQKVVWMIPFAAPDFGTPELRMSVSPSVRDAIEQRDALRLSQTLASLIGGRVSSEFLVLPSGAAAAGE